jgi:uroporphyrinogen decarboxylase
MAARAYMGLENLSIAMYDDPMLVEDIVEWQCTLGLEVLKKIFDAGITVDVANIFEDMCYNHGPLVSPRFVRQTMVPRYRRVVELLRENGVEIIYLDSDGNIDELLPIWVECGINAFYPFEVAAGMDTVAVRKRYGKNVIICGNVDKRALAKGKRAIDRELQRAAHLLSSGGFFPSCDHHIPPDVPLENMIYFVNELRKLSEYPETRRVVTL